METLSLTPELFVNETQVKKKHEDKHGEGKTCDMA